MVQSYHIVYSNVFIDSPPFSTIALTFLITPGPIRTTLQSGDFHTMEKPTRGGGGQCEKRKRWGRVLQASYTSGKGRGELLFKVREMPGNCMYLYSGKTIADLTQN